MAGSNSKSLLVLLYDNRNDLAYWVIKSKGMRLETLTEQYEVIWEDAQNYEVIAKLAGPEPVVFIEEVVQPTVRIK